MSIALVEVQVFSLAPSIPNGALAERLRRGLQNLLDEFDSRTCLQVDMKRLDIGRFYFLSSSFNSGKVGWKKWLRSSKICTLAVGKSR